MLAVRYLHELAGAEDGIGRRLLIMLRRISKYGIALAVMFLVLSVISIYKNWDFLVDYFSNSLYSIGGVVLYLLIYAVGLFLLFRAIFRR